MSEQTGEKSEQPTQRRLEDAQKRGQIPRSAEVQTVAVLCAATGALAFTGQELWGTLVGTLTVTLGHLHDTNLTANSLQGYAVTGALVLVRCVAPVCLAVIVAALLAGSLQTRFNTASEALTPNWERLNPVEGLKRVFSMGAAVPTLLGALKLSIIIGLTYSSILSILHDPIFTSTVNVARIAQFFAESCLKIVTKLILALAVIAAADYGYQFWRTWRELMMTREELKEEAKSSDGNPQIKAKRRSLLKRAGKRRMLADVPLADVVVTNPTHIAVALRYDPKTMKAPKILAKGIRKNAEQIRALAAQHQVPIVENVPLARLMFKHGKVGGEVPAELYLAVAEILAYVYRTHRYRYYAQGNAVVT